MARRQTNLSLSREVVSRGAALAKRQNKSFSRLVEDTLIEKLGLDLIVAEEGGEYQVKLQKKTRKPRGANNQPNPRK